MPLLILLISFCGNLLTYKGTGSIYSETIEDSYFNIGATPITDNGTIDTIYINNNLTVNDVESIIINANLMNENTLDDSNSVYSIYTYYVINALYFDDVSSTYVPANLTISFIDVYGVDSTFESLGISSGVYFGILLISNSTVLRSYVPHPGICALFSSLLNTQLNTSWYNFSSDGSFSDLNGAIYVKDSIGNSYFSNNLLVDLFSITSYTEPTLITDTIHLSLFDKTLNDTYNTFNKFQLPFLRNAFESVFNILEFENSYVSSFVLTSFTWMIQLLLLHVVVDTLAFIFKMYHKLMDKVV